MIVIFDVINRFTNFKKYRDREGGGGNIYFKFGLFSSVIESPIEVILSGMPYYHHSFEECIKSYNIPTMQ